LISDAQLADIAESTTAQAGPSRRSSWTFGLMTEEQLLQAVAEHLNFEFMNLEQLDLQPTLLRVMPPALPACTALCRSRCKAIP